MIYDSFDDSLAIYIHEIDPNRHLPSLGPTSSATPQPEKLPCAIPFLLTPHTLHDILQSRRPKSIHGTRGPGSDDGRFLLGGKGKGVSEGDRLETETRARSFSLWLHTRTPLYTHNRGACRKLIIPQIDSH